ncbi:MAG: hypothetical protein DI538_21675 [Azospira oryzae]|nr:MAG: hypothetical protein DI538_21675 [Azospira oryzae]
MWRPYWRIVIKYSLPLLRSFPYLLLEAGNTETSEVLIYLHTFNKDYQIKGTGRDTLGMVGTGPLENTMILSQADLRNGFVNHTHKTNTAIHEFVHLVDKSDGHIDGVPRSLLGMEYVVPWLKRIHEEIKLVKDGTSDINPYAMTSEAEFLAVAAKYFFEQPPLLQYKHPELFGWLKQLFTPSTVDIQ